MGGVSQAGGSGRGSKVFSLRVQSAGIRTVSDATSFKRIHPNISRGLARILNAISDSPCPFGAIVLFPLLKPKGMVISNGMRIHENASVSLIIRWIKFIFLLSKASDRCSPH